MNRREGLLTGGIALTLLAQLLAVLLLAEPAAEGFASRPGTGPVTVVTPSPHPVRPQPPVRPVPSSPPAGVTVLVTGTVRDLRGGAVQGATVATRRHVGGLEGFLTAFTAVTSLGLACLTGICSEDETRDTTDGTGAFRLRLPLGTELAQPGEHDVTVTTADGTATVLQHRFSGGPTQLGTLTLLTTGATASRYDGQLRVAVPALPPSVGYDLTASAQLYGRGEKPAVTLPDLRSGASVDGRLVEQGVDRLALRVSGRDPGGRRVWYRGRTTTVPAGPLPLSRGHACRGYGPGDRAVPLTPCRFTDGDLAGEVRAPYALGDLQCQSQKRCTPRNSSVVIDLGSVRAVHAVVLHGATFDVTVETSRDGRAFTEAARTDFGHGDDVVLPVTGSARFVRVHYSFSIDLRTAREASVF